MSWILQIHAAATLAMAGVIWFVQIVHYPLFADVGRDAFTEYEKKHVARTGVIVAPLMLAEIATAAALCVLADLGWPAWAGLGCLAGIWLSTALLQVPAHRKLEGAHDPAVIRYLVRSNWIRTVLWTVRGALALWLLQIGL